MSVDFMIRFFLCAIFLLMSLQSVSFGHEIPVQTIFREKLSFKKTIKTANFISCEKKTDGTHILTLVNLVTGLDLAKQSRFRTAQTTEDKCSQFLKLLDTAAKGPLEISIQRTLTRTLTIIYGNCMVQDTLRDDLSQHGFSSDFVYEISADNLGVLTKGEVPADQVESATKRCRELYDLATKDF